MAINLGSTAISDLKLGSDQVDKVYLGATEVWSKTTPPPVVTNALKFSSAGSQTLGISSAGIGSLTPFFEYSTDNGSTWTTWNITTTIQFGNGTDLYIRGTNTTLATSNSTSVNFVFSTNSLVDCTGNVMHLFDYTQDLTAFPGGHGIRNLFRDCSVLRTAPNLPATTLTQYCYSMTFRNCSALTTAPNLPATTIGNYSYWYMFSGCTSLVNAPTISATTVNTSGCQYMFSGCTSLVNAPKLPYILAQNCYGYMFSGCTSLNTIPRLNAGSLQSACYNYMFQNCSNIKMSLTSDSEYVNEYKFGMTPTANFANNMFIGTGGSFTGTPTKQTLYTANTIIR